MRNELAIGAVILLSACTPNERVDSFRLGTSCEVGEDISDCEGFAPDPHYAGHFVPFDEDEPIVLLGAPVSSLRLFVTDGIVTSERAEYEFDACAPVEALVRGALGKENRSELGLSHWRGTAFEVDFEYSIDRPACSVTIQERSTTKPFTR